MDKDAGRFKDIPVAISIVYFGNFCGVEVYWLVWGLVRGKWSPFVVILEESQRFITESLHEYNPPPE